MQNSMEQWVELGAACTEPMQQMNRISSDVFERVGKLQNHMLEDCLATNMEQLRVFGEYRDPSEFLQRETELFAGALERMRKRSEEAMEVVAVVQQDFSQLFQEGMKAPEKPAARTVAKETKSSGGKSASSGKETG